MPPKKDKRRDGPRPGHGKTTGPLAGFVGIRQVGPVTTILLRKGRRIVRVRWRGRGPNNTILQRRVRNALGRPIFIWRDEQGGINVGTPEPTNG